VCTLCRPFGQACAKEGALLLCPWKKAKAERQASTKGKQKKTTKRKAVSLFLLPSFCLCVCLFLLRDVSVFFPLSSQLASEMNFLQADFSSLSSLVLFFVEELSVLGARLSRGGTRRELINFLSSNVSRVSTAPPFCLPCFL